MFVFFVLFFYGELTKIMLILSSNTLLICFSATVALELWAATWQNQETECAPSEDSDQPGHPLSLIRVFAVHMKKACVLSYPLSAQRRLWTDRADAQADPWVFAGRTVTLLVLSCRGSYFHCFLVLWTFSPTISALCIWDRCLKGVELGSEPGPGESGLYEDRGCTGCFLVHL